MFSFRTLHFYVLNRAEIIHIIWVHYTIFLFKKSISLYTENWAIFLFFSLYKADS